MWEAEIWVSGKLETRRTFSSKESADDYGVKVISKLGQQGYECFAFTIRLSKESN